MASHAINLPTVKDFSGFVSAVFFLLCEMPKSKGDTERENPVKHAFYVPDNGIKARKCWHRGKGSLTVQKHITIFSLCEFSAHIEDCRPEVQECPSSETENSQAKHGSQASVNHFFLLNISKKVRNVNLRIVLFFLKQKRLYDDG